MLTAQVSSPGHHCLYPLASQIDSEYLFPQQRVRPLYPRKDVPRHLDGLARRAHVDHQEGAERRKILSCIRPLLSRTMESSQYITVYHLKGLRHATLDRASTAALRLR